MISLGSRLNVGVEPGRGPKMTSRRLAGASVWTEVLFFELGDTQGGADWWGRSGFSFGYAEFEMPVGHPIDVS